jgi:hypothetical protein
MQICKMSMKRIVFKEGPPFARSGAHYLSVPLKGST